VCCAELLLSPWWIAAIVCACVIILMILFCICLFLCRRNSGELCYSPDGCLMCCVGLSCDRCLRHEQPYRTRRRRHIRPVVMSHRSIDRPVYSSGTPIRSYCRRRRQRWRRRYCDHFVTMCVYVGMWGRGWRCMCVGCMSAR